MVKAIKGCLDVECSAQKERVNFRKNLNFCPHCGNKLFYVCKDCRMQFTDDTRKYCIRCESARKDEKLKDKAVNLVAKGGERAAHAIRSTAQDIKDQAAKIIKKKNKTQNSE